MKVPRQDEDRRTVGDHPLQTPNSKHNIIISTPISYLPAAPTLTNGEAVVASKAECFPPRTSLHWSASLVSSHSSNSRFHSWAGREGQ